MNSDLKEAREKAGYTIEEVSDKLNIRKQYLVHLENEDFDSLPGKAYIEGYTKMYYNFLGIPLPEKQKKELQHPQITVDEQKIAVKHKKYILLISSFLLIIVIFIYNAMVAAEEDLPQKIEKKSTNDENN
jgi:cytoskeletal protein RodZ